MQPTCKDSEFFFNKSCEVLLTIKGANVACKWHLSSIGVFLNILVFMRKFRTTELFDFPVTLLQL